MATAVIKSLKLHLGLIIVKLDGRSPEVALRVSGSDKETIASLTPGQRIRFDFACDRHGQVFAIDVVPESGITRAIRNSGSPPRSSRLPADKSEAEREAHQRNFGKADPPSQFGRRWVSRSEQAHLEELLAAPIIRRLMQRDGADPQAIRRMLQSIARVVATPR
jgi:hypothetical protein